MSDFPTPVPVGAQVRAHATVTEVDEIRGGEQLTTDVRIEIRGSDRPGCVAQVVWRHYDLDTTGQGSR